MNIDISNAHCGPRILVPGPLLAEGRYLKFLCIKCHMSYVLPNYCRTNCFHPYNSYFQLNPCDPFIPSRDTCFSMYNPVFPCINQCFPFWSCTTGPCPAEPLTMPQCFPCFKEKKKKKKKKKRPKEEKEPSKSEPNLEVDAIENPCKCCRRCSCMGLKLDQSCRQGPCGCCKVCPCNVCKLCKPNPPPKSCSCNPLSKPCSCVRGNRNGHGDVCDNCYTSVKRNTKLVRCEKCGHRKQVEVSKDLYDPEPKAIIVARSTSTVLEPFTATTRQDYQEDGLRVEPVSKASFKSVDTLENKSPLPIKTLCKGCSKPKKLSYPLPRPSCPRPKYKCAPRLCSGCRALGL